MTTKRTERQKTRAAFARAFKQAGAPSLPAFIRANWRNILMPWRMLPMPIAWALIGLVALAMVLDTGSEEAPVVAAPHCIAVDVDAMPTDAPFPTGTVAPPTVEPTTTASPTASPTATPTPTSTPIP